jgi:Colicin D
VSTFRREFQQIVGTYRGSIAVTHYFDPITGLNVMVDVADEFIGGWRLTAAQQGHLLASGNVQ